MISLSRGVWAWYWSTWRVCYGAFAALWRDRFSCTVVSLALGCHGVTLLAFGNGAPDVFSASSAVANMKNGDVGLVFGALLGAYFVELYMYASF